MRTYHFRVSYYLHYLYPWYEYTTMIIVHNCLIKELHILIKVIGYPLNKAILNHRANFQIVESYCINALRGKIVLCAASYRLNNTISYPSVLIIGDTGKRISG